MAGRVLTARQADRLLAAGIAVIFGLEIASEARFAGDEPQSVALASLFCLALVLRRRLAVAAVGAGLVVIVGSNAWAPALGDTGAFALGFLIALYSLGRYGCRVEQIVAAPVMAAAVPLAATEPGSSVSFTDTAFFALLFAAPWATGALIRRRYEREHVLVAQQHVRAREAVIEERARIARELHDIVSHAISVMVLQARGGRRMLDTDVAETRRALDAIELAGGQALDEMRRLLSLLRAADGAPSRAPQPGLRHLDELADSVRAAGLPVELAVEGEPIPLPAGIDVSAYRIVQEALTNALKHAGPAHARVTVTYGADALGLAIVDDGPGDPSGEGSGHGMVGMRERVAVYRGVLESGVAPDGGYAVRVRLPVAPGGR